MDPGDLFEAWKHQRRRPEVPEGFADRLVASLQGTRPPAGGRFQRLFAPWPVRAAVCALAGLACLVRMVSFVAMFIPG
jgi:hypothetical protein